MVVQITTGGPETGTPSSRSDTRQPSLTTSIYGREQSARRVVGWGWGTGDERAADHRDVPRAARRRKSDAAQDLRTGARGLRTPNGGGHPRASGGNAESLPPGGGGAGGAHGRRGVAHRQGKSRGHQATPAAARRHEGEQGERGSRVEDQVQDPISTRSSGDVTGAGTGGTTSLASMT